jgi:large subunit ribosomal protein L11
MSKKKTGVRNLQLICGQARPGSNLAFLKNMVLFCKEFNEKTKDKHGEPINVEIITYNDNSYNYTISTTPSSHLLKNALGEKKEITQKELEKIAEEIMTSLNTEDIEQAKKIVAGTVRSFNGIKIIE